MKTKMAYEDFKALRDEVAALQAENARLREALEEAANALDNSYDVQNHKCSGGRNHRWNMSARPPVCVDCDKTGPEVAAIKREGRNRKVKPSVLQACITAMEHFMIDWEDFKHDYADSPLGETAKKIQAALALARGERGKG